MKKKVLYVGLDVDDKSFHAYLICSQSSESFQFSSRPNVNSLCDKLKKFASLGFEIKICHEASYLGFSLHRELQSRGFHSDVIAPSSMLREPGARVKTDRLDSKKLATHYKNNLLAVVHVPDEKTESNRNIIRTRKFLVQKLKQVKLHALSICRRANLHFRSKSENKNLSYWTRPHYEWLYSILSKMEDPSLKFNLECLLVSCRQLEGQIKIYEDKIEKLSKQKEYTNRVNALNCYRGFATLTSMTLITELGDINRFSHPRQLTSYVGLDLAEYSSGGKEKKFGITKKGNVYIRHSIVEAAQSANRIPRISKQLKKRRESGKAEHIEIADRCMSRLFKKSSRLQQRGKHTNKVKVACAREMLGFVWESLKVEEKKFKL